MAKRDEGTKRKKEGATGVSGATAADVQDSRVVAFAEHLGRIAGTLQGKADALMDAEALKRQIATVRDGAADLLAQLAASVPTIATKKPAASSARRTAKGRSGGVVDAPGKKHRKPPPAGSGATVADSQAAKVRMAKTMVKTSRRRGRG